MIKIHNLHKAFGQKQVLNGIDLTISDGETICVIGKSGCGKSVLLKHVVGLLDGDQGHVEVDGKNVDPNDLTITKRQLEGQELQWKKAVKSLKSEFGE
jgi:ABC-type polar amino acid transport system ATPase subunit